MRVVAAISVAALLCTMSLWGSGSAYANANQEQQACQLMDDPAGHDLGYQPAEYAFMVLRGTMTAVDARNVIALATQDFCPNHVMDLPASWR
ncbi:hypothetical protein [Mycobacterium stomatepiae]|uniref:DUF732 domain-containing protein n=1 Tax=Mycobacterium stomatepiae TaxID=470076 RepID=A0A7I7Q408_9MYCO|nr:hypothetical protein [Mycobacterium stomatepiae]MCV7163652.1 hypothetical protein [Mycobacterium stomatepiae]BBY21085.1 hypothetical protein MSTO_12900 [Mycobacterium stomatepiae]